MSGKVNQVFIPCACHNICISTPPVYLHYNRNAPAPALSPYQYTRWKKLIALSAAIWKQDSNPCYGKTKLWGPGCHQEKKTLNAKLLGRKELPWKRRNLEKSDDGDDIISGDGNVANGNYRETCTFCNPMRCRTCEKRNQVVSFISSVLI